MDKLTTKMYNLAYTHYFPWVKYIKSILDECGLSYLWTTQQIHSVAWVKNTVKRIFLDQNIQAWKSTVLIHLNVLITGFIKNPLNWKNIY